jgi:uncharacterized membrane-anchored protein YjiN (DUF445 family)
LVTNLKPDFLTIEVINLDYCNADRLNERLAGAENENKRLRLVFMKTIAGGMLGFFVILFLISTHYRSTFPWLSYVKAFSEAAMVGGLADWFAVVALFRKPFSLPIPHTAIIPENKKRIANSLGDFIKNNFLSTSKIIEKVRDFNISGTFASYFASDDGAKFASKQMVALLEKIIFVVENDKVAEFVKTGLETYLRKVDVSTLAAGGLDLLTRDNAHQSLLNYVVNELNEFLQDDGVRENITERVSKEIPAFAKFIGMDQLAAKYIAEKLITASIKYVQEVKEDKDHPICKRFDAEVALWVDKLRNDPFMKFKGEQIRDRILSSDVLASYLNNLWFDLSEWLLKDLRSNNSQVKDKIHKVVMDFSVHLANDEDLKSLINSKIEEEIPGLLDRYRDTIGNFISKQIEDWDDQYMVDQLELNIGKDMQFIRINGTLVGGCAGLIIYLISNFV